MYKSWRRVLPRILAVCWMESCIEQAHQMNKETKIDKDTDNHIQNAQNVLQTDKQ
jgi:hypothetical protein